ncbi:MAG TPA: T9SS type A sorting domain-containing protein [Saprospiraceae bacterium]|nr:T9SS type A sorting domain-containing protein [Saprospiraceae bacterium]
MNTKIKFSLLGILLFLAHFVFAITVELTPSTFPCGTTTVSATTGCNFMGAMEVTVEGNPSGVAISNVSMIIGGTFTFDVTVDATSPAVGQLNFKILTSNDPTGCALPNAQDDVPVSFTCACNLIVTTTTTDESCFECANGSATVIVDGAIEPISYTWSNGAFTNGIDNLAPGDYSVIIEDGNDCTATATVTILPFICGPFQILATVTNAVCFDDCNGSIVIDGLSDGTVPTNIEWSTNADSTVLSDLCAGTYSVTVTNDKNCTSITTFVVSQAAPIVLTIDSIINHSPATPGQVIISMSGVVSGYACACVPITGTCGVCSEFSTTSTTMEGLSVGCYQMSITNPNGCVAITDTFCVQGMTSSVRDFDFSNVKIYPNPTSDVVNIIYENGSLPKEMVLKNVFGTTIARYNDTNSLDVSSLPSGMYFLTFNDENHIFTRSFTVQR